MEPRLLLSAAVHQPAKKVAKKATPIAITSTIQLPITLQQEKASTPVKTKAAKGKKSTVTLETAGFTSPYGNAITPAQMQGAYVGTNFNFDGITGDGTGQTIAIVDAYNDPGLVNSNASNFNTSDLAQFDAAYHLPNPPSFTKYGDTFNVLTGQYVVSSTVPTQTDPNGPYSSTNKITWEIEESLDVEWAHVIAPMANIVLIEAPSALGINLYYAVQAATNLAGVSVVSMSFGTDENRMTGSGGNPTEFTANGYFNKSAGITFVAAAGDTGAYGTSAYSETTTIEPQFPAVSPYVLSVGGTTLGVSGTSWSSENTWGNGTSSGTSSGTAGGGGGGGGTSLSLNKPSWQTGFGSGSLRQYPDISMDGNTNSGVDIYDSWDFGSTTPWVPGTIAGTSLAAPMMAGLVAIADQGRALRGLLPLNSNSVSGGTDVHTLLYSLAGNSTSYAADFHDITSGSDTGPSGAAPNFSPETGYDLATGLGTPVANTYTTDLAYYNSSVGSSTLAINQPAITSLFAKPDSNTAYMDVWVNSASPGNGTPTYKFPVADISSYTDQGGSEAFTITLSNVIVNGSSSTLSFTGTTASNTAISLSANSVIFGSSQINFANVSTVYLNPEAATNPLTVIGSVSGIDTFITNTNALTLNALAVNFTSVSTLTLNPGTGLDVLNVSSGTTYIATQTTGGGILTRNFSSISIAANSSAIFSTAALHTDRMLVETTTLSLLGRLDLGGNDMIIHNGTLSAINALVATGYNGGLWTGAGITSAAAHGDTTHLTALGVIQNTLYGGSGQSTFDGTSPVPTDVLIKYTYYGDATLDGKIDGTDYSRIDNAYHTTLTGWYNGNFNYDNHIDGSDYTLIDNAFNTQGSVL